MSRSRQPKLEQFFLNNWKRSDREIILFTRLQVYVFASDIKMWVASSSSLCCCCCCCWLVVIVFFLFFSLFFRGDSSWVLCFGSSSIADKTVCRVTVKVTSPSLVFVVFTCLSFKPAAEPCPLISGWQPLPGAAKCKKTQNVSQACRVETSQTAFRSQTPT